MDISPSESAAKLVIENDLIGQFDTLKNSLGEDAARTMAREHVDSLRIMAESSPHRYMSAMNMDGIASRHDNYREEIARLDPKIAAEVTDAGARFRAGREREYEVGPVHVAALDATKATATPDIKLTNIPETPGLSERMGEGWVSISPEDALFLEASKGIHASIREDRLKKEATIEAMPGAQHGLWEADQFATLNPITAAQSQQAPAMSVEAGHVREATADRTPPRHQVGRDASGFINQNAQIQRDLADSHGLTPVIEKSFSEGKTAAEVATELKNKMAFLPFDERGNFVVSVRATLGIPSRASEEGKVEFDAWKSAYDKRMEPSEAKRRAEISATIDAPPKRHARWANVGSQTQARTPEQVAADFKARSPSQPLPKDQPQAKPAEPKQQVRAKPEKKEEAKPKPKAPVDEPNPYTKGRTKTSTARKAGKVATHMLMGLSGGYAVNKLYDAITKKKPAVEQKPSGSSRAMRR